MYLQKTKVFTKKKAFTNLEKTTPLGDPYCKEHAVLKNIYIFFNFVLYCYLSPFALFWIVMHVTFSIFF